jgi:di/tripeptidase
VSVVPYQPDAPAPAALAAPPEARVFRERLVETFERHVRLDSQSDRAAATVPTTPEQRAFAQVLAADLRGLGFQRIAVDEWANVSGHLPGTAPGRPLFYSAHLDVVDAAPCSGIVPVRHDYAGGDLAIAAERGLVIPAERLAAYVGDLLVTSDGHTLLGADDKLGIAEVLHAIRALLVQGVPHPNLYVAFYSDEETGLQGAKRFDLAALLGDVPLDTVLAVETEIPEAGKILVETYNADTFTIEVQGQSKHPAIEPERIVSPSVLVAEIVQALQPYRPLAAGASPYLLVTDTLTDQSRGTIRMLARAFDTPDLEGLQAIIPPLVRDVLRRHYAAYPDLLAHLDGLWRLDVVREYRNPRLDPDGPEVQLVAAAGRHAGLPVETVRLGGGVDGSALAERGLRVVTIGNASTFSHSLLELASISKAHQVAAQLFYLAQLATGAEGAAAAPSARPVVTTQPEVGAVTRAETPASARAIAIDWSGDLAGGHKKIWLAEAVRGDLVRLESGRRREAIAELLIEAAERDPRLIVGLDFAFSLPAWFLAERGLRTAPDLWALVAEEGEAWLRACLPPFWGRPGTRRPTLDPARPEFRRTELEVPAIAGTRPKSVFQIGGAGAVGTGSLRGMPLLHRLHPQGFAIWPFDPPAWPLVVEIYPRLLTDRVVKSNRAACEDYLRRHYPGLSPRWLQPAAASEDAFDAAVSALVMAEHLPALSALPSLADPMTRLEGLIWYPSWQVSAASTPDGSY